MIDLLSKLKFLWAYPAKPAFWVGMLAACMAGQGLQAQQVDGLVNPMTHWQSPATPVTSPNPAAKKITPSAMPRATMVTPRKVETMSVAQTSVSTSVAEPLPTNTVAPTNSRDVVGVGDVLQISVFGSADLSAEVVVADNGQISLPLVGNIPVENKNSEEVAALYADRLVRGQYVKDPKVSVQIRQQRSRQISVLGEVQKPGRYPMQGRTAILDALSLAGGLTPRADKTVTLLRREPGSNGPEKQIVLPLRLDDATNLARQTLEQELQPDDVVYVGAQKVFYVYGEVRRPGMYPIEDELNVMRALSISGGVTERGSTRRIKITREQSPGKTIELRANISEPIKAGDVIFVDERIF